MLKRTNKLWWRNFLRKGNWNNDLVSYKVMVIDKINCSCAQPTAFLG